MSPCAWPESCVTHQLRACDCCPVAGDAAGPVLPEPTLWPRRDLGGGRWGVRVQLEVPADHPVPGICPRRTERGGHGDPRGQAIGSLPHTGESEGCPTLPDHHPVCLVLFCLFPVVTIQGDGEDANLLIFLRRGLPT